MIRKYLTTKRNPYLFSTIITISAVLGWVIAKYVLGSRFDFVELLVFAVIFWIIYFLIQYWTTKRLETKK